jgi:cephalosporin hydroxylase
MSKSLFGKSWETFEQRGIKGFVLKFTGFLSRKLKPVLVNLEPCLYPYAVWKISHEIKKEATAVSLINFLFDKFGHLIKPKQIRWEILELAKIVEKLKPRVVLEVGTARGGTLFIFSRLADKEATIISLDLPWEHSNDYPQWREKLYQKFASAKQKMFLMREDSHQPETLEKLKTILAGKDIDFLLIDGDHTYDGVKRDFELYSPLVKTGGVIAFHDIAKHNSTPECQVDRFWDEIKLGKNSKELIHSQDQDWGGIGVIYK